MKREILQYGDSLFLCIADKLEKIWIKMLAFPLT